MLQMLSSSNFLKNLQDKSRGNAGIDRHFKEKENIATSSDDLIPGIIADI